jgi:flagellar motor switch protein FliN
MPDTPAVHADLRAILALEVPVIVRVGERIMSLGEVMALVPGAIIELPKNSEEELDLLVNNKQIGTGTAAKVGENFGLRITFLGDVRQRITALGQAPPPPEDGTDAQLESAFASQI